MISSHWSLLSLAIISIALLIVYFWYDRREVTVKEIPLITTLAAFAGLSRVPFAVIPSLQPTTFLVLITGYVFGTVPGFMVGSLAAFVSNLFLGHGPWTPWQMMAWGLVGVSGGLLNRWNISYVRLPLLVLAVVWGFLFGWILNIWHWLTFVYPLSIRSFIAIQITSLWFDVIHGVGNLLFMYFLGADLIKILQRFKRRLTISYLYVKE